METSKEPSRLFMFYYLLMPFSKVYKAALGKLLTSIYEPINSIIWQCNIALRFVVAFELVDFTVRFIVWEINSPYLTWKLWFIGFIFGVKIFMFLLKRNFLIRKLERVYGSFLGKLPLKKKRKEPASELINDKANSMSGSDNSLIRDSPSTNLNDLSPDKVFKTIRAEFLTAR